MHIRELFDPSKDIYRTIEKVISYGAAQEDRLRAEVAEYIVTESIDEQLEALLRKMQAAMEAGGVTEIGVWVSGFYGSGKSSFTKYLGLAFDDGIEIDGKRFLEYLRDRLLRPDTKALLITVSKRFPAAVVLLDLATEQVAGATLEVVSTVLYYKVLQFAGYSRNLKVAAFERKLRKDGRLDEFVTLFQQETGEPWCNYQNDELVVDSLLPDLAHRLYPELFRSPHAFSAASHDSIYLMKDRVAEILDIVREYTGKDYVLFVIDEVGQYVGSNQNKILDLQGLAENLKNLAAGRAWLIGTAQQTLTDDNPSAALNSPELFKVKDRFPIRVNLESGDIKEICCRRLLGKSARAAETLGALFDAHGQALRHNTRLKDAKFYDADFDRRTFTDLYPFLPAHFDILLHLLGALAKSTGGIGLRSAIRVIQDILIEGTDAEPPLADCPVGRLATCVTLFDALHKDVERAVPSVYQGIGKVRIQYPDSSLHQGIAKTVAVLQVLGNLPVTRHNVASLMHPEIAAPSRADAVAAAIDDLLGHPRVPLGEQDGGLSFFSEKLNDIEQQRAELPLRSPQLRGILHEALRNLFSPLPSARLHDSLAVTAGLKVQAGAQTAGLAGEREPIQIIAELVPAADYATARTRLLDESRHKTAERSIFLLGRGTDAHDRLIAEVYRSRSIVELHRNDPDQEVKDYCASQADRAARLLSELQRGLQDSLTKGSLLFRGQATAVDSLAPELLAAAKQQLASAAGQVFDRYPEAPERVDTAVAERFLRTGNLMGITSQLDPLGLVQVGSGGPSIRTDHKAMVSIRDHIDRTGTVEGKRLLDHFAAAPFGWSPDTTRYLLAALLVAGEIKLKVAGREITANGQQAVDALKTNASFKAVGVALRCDRIANEVLVRAAERLTELVGDLVVPLEPDVCKAAAKHLPQLQHRIAPLAERLTGLALPGADRVRALNQQIADLLFTDASDAPQLLGAPDSELFEALQWARAAHLALEQGLAATVADLNRHRDVIAAQPSSGIPGRLREDSADDLELLTDRLGRPDFHAHAADLATVLSGLQARVATAVQDMAAAQTEKLRTAEGELARLPEWTELTRAEQDNALRQVAALAVTAEPDLDGLGRLRNSDFDINATLDDLKTRIRADGSRRRAERERAPAQPGGDSDSAAAGSPNGTVQLPLKVTSRDELQRLIARLQDILHGLPQDDALDIRFALGDDAPHD
jgi:hypothetical protein